MNTAKNLVRISGAVNALFVLFHLWLAWRFHQALQIPQNLRVMLEIFNGCGSLPILFLALAGLIFPQEIVSTGIGRLVLGLGASIYLLRAALEFILIARPSPAIMATCLITGSLYVAAWIFARQDVAHTQTAC